MQKQATYSALVPHHPAPGKGILGDTPNPPVTWRGTRATFAVSESGQKPWRKVTGATN